MIYLKMYLKKKLAFVFKCRTLHDRRDITIGRTDTEREKKKRKLNSNRLLQKFPYDNHPLQIKICAVKSVIRFLVHNNAPQGQN